MKQARGKALSFRVDDVVAIKSIKSIRLRLFALMSSLAKFSMLEVTIPKLSQVVEQFQHLSKPIAETYIQLQIMFLISPKRSPFHQLANGAIK